jgi:hypothetical protein
MDRYRSLTSQQRWIASTVLGAASYLVILSSGRSIPTPIRLLCWFIPIGLIGYSISQISSMEEEISEGQGMRALLKQQEEHAIVRQHQLNMVSREVDFLGTLKAMHDEYGIQPNAPSPQDGNWGFNLGQPFGLLEASIPLDRKVVESLGEPALALWHYVSTKGHNVCDKEGWIKISTIRANWGKDRNLNTEGVREILSGLNSFGIGEWKDARLQDWKISLTL